MNTWDQDKYIRAWNFASLAHKGQTVPGNKIPYINHVGSVAMEGMSAIAHDSSVSNPDLLVQCALLHDVLEDTDINYAQLSLEFGAAVADGVLALSKNKRIPDMEKQMADSLKRIKKQPKEVWMVKLADRITNLQPPPKHWSREKIINYREEAGLILEALCVSNKYLEDRLRRKISEYGRFAQGDANTNINPSGISYKYTYE